MNDRKSIWDPLRKKEVVFTPEEEVRQWCIGMLTDYFKVPLHMMMSEVGFSLGDKRLRADIVVYDRQARPVMIVECKRPDVEISHEVLDQAIRYNMVLDVRYILITNGRKSYLFGRKECDGKRGYAFLETIPSYNEMICQQL